MPNDSPKKWLFIAALVFISPETPGVFELWEDEELIYVGTTRRPHESIRASLIRHFKKEGGGDHPPTHFSWEVTYHAASRKRELLVEFEALNHRAPRFNRSSAKRTADT